MTQLTHLFALTTILAGTLAGIAIGSPRHLWLKASALATATLLLPVAYAALAALLSQPKPVALEWWHRHAEEATVLDSVFREGEGIDVWLQLPGSVSPGAYTLPWSTTLAEQLQRAQREAEEQEGDVRMRSPFEPSWDDREPKFYALPPPKMPEKDGEEVAPEVYERPGEEA